MKQPMRTRVAALFVVSLLPAAECLPSPSVDSIAESYRSWQLLTPKPISVSSAILALCIPAPPELIESEKRRTGPHFNARVNLYANPSAVAGFGTASVFPVGAVVVKEKLVAGDAISGVGGMRKRESGYDPANGDWEYFYWDGSAPAVFGRIPNCVSCHTKAKATDYVYTRPERWR